MLEIDFEKLSKISLLEAYEKREVFLDSSASDKLFLKCEKRGINIKEEMNDLTMEIYGMCLLHNYHMALTEILNEKGIRLNEI